MEPSGFCEAKNSSRFPLGVRQIADHGKKLKIDPQTLAVSWLRFGRLVANDAQEPGVVRR
jgi:hypothetical protein